MLCLRSLTAGHVPGVHHQGGTAQEDRAGIHQHLAAACQGTGSWAEGHPVRREGETASRPGGHLAEERGDRQEAWASRWGPGRRGAWVAFRGRLDQELLARISVSSFSNRLCSWETGGTYVGSCPVGKEARRRACRGMGAGYLCDVDISIAVD